MEECESASVCGQIERHPAQKKELQELAKKKQKVEGELKAYQSELKVKEKISNDVEQSFEAKIHDILIRTNPGKYLTDQKRPKEGIILADSYVIKKYYDGKNPDKMKLEQDSDIFQTVIKSYEDKRNLKQPKNSVIKQYQEHGIQWPNPGTCQPAVQSPSQMFSYPDVGWNMIYGSSFPGFPMAVQQPFFSPHSNAVASPPPPLPDKEQMPPLPESDSNDQN